jgi:hypothetical protein
MNPTQLIQRQKVQYWQAKTIQNLANPNRGVDPQIRSDIKYRLDANLGDVIPKFFASNCCYPFSGSIPLLPTSSALFPELIWSDPMIIDVSSPNTETHSIISQSRSIELIAQVTMSNIGQPLLFDQSGSASVYLSDELNGTVLVNVPISIGLTSCTVFVYDNNGPNTYLIQTIPFDGAFGLNPINYPHTITGSYSYNFIVPSGIQVVAELTAQIGGGDIIVGPLSGSIDISLQFEPL